MKTKINQMVIFRKSRGCHLKIILHSYLLSCQVLSYHIPFLVSSIEDFKDHIPRETDMKVKKTSIWILRFLKVRFNKSCTRVKFLL